MKIAKLALNPEFNLYERNGLVFCSSRQVAESFNKRHDNVLRDIENTIDSLLKIEESDWKNNFIESSYKERGKKYPEYLLSRDGFTLLTMGFTGEKALRFKIAYIKRFNNMEAFIKSLLATKIEFPAFTDAIMSAHEEPKHYHFSNEINMIYRIVLGMDAKKFREAHGIEKGAVIKPHLTLNQIQAVETLQRCDIGLILAISDFQQRKNALENHFKKIVASRCKLIATA